MKKGMVCLILVLSLGIQTLGSQLPNVKAKGAVLIEKESGRILFEKNAMEPLPMASTTKIMTCILALERARLDDVVTTSKRASSAPPVKLHLRIGEKQYLGDLLYALMLQSNNDAAVAIAEHVSGSVEAFCEAMTQKAHEIGATHTVFKTPNGLDAEGHQSSAYDMALIGAYALENPEFIKIMTTTSIHIPTKPLEGSQPHDLQNKNRFLYSYEGANGMKTGFTNKAGHCFVGSAVKGNMQLVGVALGSGWGQTGKTQKYTDVIQMMNYGFKNYKKYHLLPKTKDSVCIPVIKGVQKEVSVGYEADVCLPLTKEEYEKIQVRKVLPETLQAPLEAGQQVGSLEIRCGEEVLAAVPLYIEQSVRKATPIDQIKNWLKQK